MSKTTIYKLPNFWLTAQERQWALDHLFSSQERNLLKKYRESNQIKLQQAKIIIVDIVKADGFLGDTIRDSRLTGVLKAYFPHKIVLEWSNYPSLLGKRPFLTSLKERDEKIVLTYKEEQDQPEKEIVYPQSEAVKVVKTSPRFSGVYPLVSLHEDYGQGLIFRRLALHCLQLSQVIWEFLYGLQKLDSLPEPSLKIPQETRILAHQSFQKLPLNFQKPILIIHPDAHESYFKQKAWPVQNWVELIRLLKTQAPEISICLSTGASHPETSQEISQQCQKQKLPLITLPLLPLPVYTGLLESFGKKAAIFVGLESAIGSHLAPSLGLKSIVIGSDEVFSPLVFGPFGGIVIMSNDHKTASVEPQKVSEAILTSLAD